MPAVDYRLVSIDLGGGRSGVVALPAPVVEYFKMPVTTASAEARIRKRKEHTRRNYKNILDNEGDPYIVREATWTDTPTAPKRGAGNLILVPTAKKTNRGNVRMVSMNMPSLAVTGAISEFLFTKCTANKPTFFLTSRGVPHLVVNISGDVNPTPPPKPKPPQPDNE